MGGGLRCGASNSFGGLGQQVGGLGCGVGLSVGDGLGGGEVSFPAKNGASSPLNQPDPSSMSATMNEVVFDGLAPLSLQPSDVICGSHQYCSKQPGNIKLNNLVLDRRGGYKSIDSYNRGCKAEYVVKIVREVELLGGRFLMRNSSDNYSVATDELKKETVQQRL